LYFIRPLPLQVAAQARLTLATKQHRVLVVRAKPSRAEKNSVAFWIDWNIAAHFDVKSAFAAVLGQGKRIAARLHLWFVSVVCFR
jgi:hypothetical protein